LVQRHPELNPLESVQLFLNGRIARTEKNGIVHDSDRAAPPPGIEFVFPDQTLNSMDSKHWRQKSWPSQLLLK
jgi:hypothetical protein